MTTNSPFAISDAKPIAEDKFRNPLCTASGEERASVKFQALKTLWFNTGTLCNLACENCYIESSPRNDALVYLTADEVKAYLDEIAALNMPTREIAFTGGEPFMNPEIIEILRACLERDFEVLVLTNAMRPMQRFKQALLELPSRERLTFRVSLDHFTQELHELERGVGSWEKAIAGLLWLQENTFPIAIAGRRPESETEEQSQHGFAQLFKTLNLSIDSLNPEQLTLFPEMDANADVPEITNSCWDILGVRPSDIMCSSSRMVVKRKGENGPRVAACTLLPYDAQFDLGATLEEASDEIQLNHPHCARFCVLGGASCSA